MREKSYKIFNKHKNTNQNYVKLAIKLLNMINDQTIESQFISKVFPFQNLAYV